MTASLRSLFVILALFASIPVEAQPKPIIVGQTFVESGPLAHLSPGPVIGVRAMLTMVNESGGVHGRPIELRQADDAYSAEKAADNVKKFVNDGALAILMPIGTTPAQGALRAANELKVPLVGPYTGAGGLRKHSPYGFFVRIGFNEEYERIIQHLFTIGITRIACAHNDNPGARSAMEATKKLIEARGKAMVGSVAIKNDTSDAEARAQELAVLKPEAVVLSMDNAVAAKFIRAYRAAGTSTQFYSFSFLNGAQLHKSIGADATGVVISQVTPYPWNVASPLIQEYQAAMKRLGETEFSHSSLEGYINAKVLVEGLRRAGPNPSTESLKVALESLHSFDLGGLTLRYGPSQHNGLLFSELTMVRKDGGYAK